MAASDFQTPAERKSLDRSVRNFLNFHYVGKITKSAENGNNRFARGDTQIGEFEAYILFLFLTSFSCIKQGFLRHLKCVGMMNTR